MAPGTSWSSTRAEDLVQGWDTIIVGAGSAGATLAGRLSEDPATQVLLLEAGPDFRSVETPAGFRTRSIDMTLESNPEFWWPRLTARRTPAQEPYYYMRGRGMGGSSTVNGLCAIRGVPGDYDRWAELGAAGWSFEEVLPFFILMEDEHDFGDRPYHGRGGPVPVYREPEAGWSALDVAFRDAALSIGYPLAEDHNAPGSTGLSPFAMNIRDGRRVSTNDAYLEPARGRPNLTIRGGSHVDTVLLEPRTLVARGVRLADGERRLLNPGGEVLVCSGAVHSPAILMRSGIGPAATLRDLGIEVLCDLPVGIGVQDHAMLVVRLPTLERAHHSLDGRVTNCVLRYSSGLGGAGENDMMMLPNKFIPLYGSGCLIVQQEQVFSRGRLAIASRDPMVDPQIDLQLLEEESDRLRMEDAIERMGEVAAQPAFAAMLDGRPIFPDPQELPRLIQDTLHVCSSCRMGSPGAAGTVVDPECRVLGTEGLRVIDASIMPEVTRANLHLTVVMIAERMAGRLREMRA